MKNKIKIGQSYEFRPDGFIYKVRGTAIEMENDGVLFEVERCDMLDRQRLTNNKMFVKYDEVNNDVKKDCFFS